MGTDELLGRPDEMLGALGEVTVTYIGLASHPGEVAILQLASCYRNRDKLRHGVGHFGHSADVNFYKDLLHRT